MFPGRDPNWAPTLHLGHNKFQLKESTLKRHERQVNRKRRRIEEDGLCAKDIEQACGIVGEQTSTSYENSIPKPNENLNVDESNENPSIENNIESCISELSDDNSTIEKSSENYSMTDMTGSQIRQMELELRRFLIENAALRGKVEKLSGAICRVCLHK